MNQLISFIHENFTPILGALTIISFVLNVIQHKTKKTSVHIFSSIYHTADRAFKENKDNEKSSEEYNALMIAIRHQAVSGLRSADVNWYYEDDGVAGGNGFIYGFLSHIYRILVAIRIKLPQLITGKFAQSKNED